MATTDDGCAGEICEERREPSTWILALLGLALCFALSLLVLSPPSFRAWWIIEGTLLAFVTACVCVAVFWARRSLPLVLLVVALSLIYLFARPGGWFYDKSTPYPAWSTITRCDGGYYWRSAIALKSGENPFNENWYPPPFVQLFALLSSLAEQRAFASWWVVVYGSYMAAVILTHALLRTWLPIWPATALTALCWLTNWPAYETVADMQINLIVLSLLLYAWVRAQSSMPLSAAALAAAALLKITPLIPAGLVAAVHRPAWTAGLLVSLVLIVGISLAVGPQYLWPQFLAEISGREWASKSIDTAMIRLLGSQVGMISTLVIKLGVVACALVHLWRAKGLQKCSRLPRGISTVDLAFAVGICCMVILSPVIWAHHRVWFVPALAFAWAFCRARLLPGLAAITALLLWLPMPPGISMLSVVLPALALLWCLSPANLASDDEDTALTVALRALARSDAECDHSAST